jgi:hypothetical protein
VRTTDSIIEDLVQGCAERLAASEHVDVGAVQQQIIAHQELARLRERRAAALKMQEHQLAGDLDAQIQHWLRFVTEDVDERVAGDPKKNTTKLVAPAAPADTAVKG